MPRRRQEAFVGVLPAAPARPPPAEPALAEEPAARLVVEEDVESPPAPQGVSDAPARAWQQQQARRTPTPDRNVQRGDVEDGLPG
eukprot:3564307-Amphidinium_carterae.1